MISHHVFLSLVLLLPLLLAAAPQGWEADPAVITNLSQKHPGVIYDESKVPAYVLPDVMRLADGTVATTVEQWKQRRSELLELFRSRMHGRVPATHVDMRFEVVFEDPAALNGAATHRRVAIRVAKDLRQHTFELNAYLPNRTTDSSSPALLLIDNRGPGSAESNGFWPVGEIVARGFATASFFTSDVAPDDPRHFRDGVIRVFEGDPLTRPADAWGAIAAWAWGASRAMDYLATEPRIDAHHVAVIGHSRGGKTALWAAANDQRFAIAIANASGCGGSALARRRFGETTRMLNEHFMFWFCDNYKHYDDRENELPFDQHELVALIAPRPVYFTAMTEDLWADPRGSFLALAEASPAYALWNIPPFPRDPLPPIGEPLVAGKRGFHIRAGKHDLTGFEWRKFMDFADAMWRLHAR